MSTFFERISPNGVPEFQQFTFTHYITIVILVILTIFSIEAFKRIKQGRLEKVIRYSIGAFMLLSNITIYLYAYNYDLPWYYYIPEATCGWAIYFGGLSMFTKNRTLFILTLFWGFGSVLTMIGSNVLEGPLRYNFYQFQLRHLLIVIAPIYLIIVHDFKVYKKDFKTYFYVTFIMATIGGFISYSVNDPESLNLFFMMKPGMEGTPLSLFYDISYYLYVVIWILLATLLGYLYGLIFYEKEQSKSNLNA